MRARHWISVFATAVLALTSCAAFAQGNAHGYRSGCRHVIIGGHSVLLNFRTNCVYSVVHFEIQ